MKRFNKLVLYDLKACPLEKNFVIRLKKIAKEVKIVFASKEYGKALKAKDMKDADALITRLFDFYDNNIFSSQALKYIGAMHTDCSHFNFDLLKKNNVVLTNVPGYSTEAVAELTISALLNISRKTCEAMGFVKNGNWGFENFMGWELKGKTLGIIGFGKIGERVARIAQVLGMKIVYFSRTKKKMKGAELLPLQELLKRSDVVSLHCSLNKKTKNILNKTNLKLMKKGSALLNSGRSELVDLDALYLLCKNKKISIWFEAIEEKKIRDKFSKLNNVYLTPHFGWMTKEAQERLRNITIENIEAYLKGGKLNRIV